VLEKLTPEKMEEIEGVLETKPETGGRYNPPPTFRSKMYLLRSILVYQPKDLNRDWSPRSKRSFER
jgi:hypothetical protein